MSSHSKCRLNTNLTPSRLLINGLFDFLNLSVGPLRNAPLPVLMPEHDVFHLGKPIPEIVGKLLYEIVELARRAGISMVPVWEFRPPGVTPEVFDTPR